MIELNTRSKLSKLERDDVVDLPPLARPASTSIDTLIGGQNIGIY